MKDDGLMIVTLLTDVNGSDKTTASWASQFGVTHPVVNDVGAQITNAYGTGGYYPNLHVIGQGMEVVLRVGSGATKPSKSDIEAVLSQMQ